MIAWLHAFDGPSLRRDLTSMLSPLRLGFWFTLLNGGLLWLLGSAVFAAASDVQPFGEVARQAGLGQYLAAALMLALGAVLTVLMPLRSVGCLDVPRWGKYFDQVVLCGISPQRYIAGKMVSLNLFFLLVLFATLPYAIFALSLGGTQLSYVLWSLLALWLYANVLSLVTITLGMFLWELLAALLVILVGGILYFWSAVPIPPLPAVPMPSHVFLEPFYALMLEGGNVPFDPRSVELDLFGRAVTLDTWQAFVSGVVVWALVAGVAALLGPARCLVPETSAFGEVVMQGDSRKAGLFRRHRQLQRRAEVSFFYENRPDLLVRYEAPLRLGWLLLIALVPLLPVLSNPWMGLAPSYHPGEAVTVAFTLFGFSFAWLVLVFTCDRATVATRMRWGTRTVPLAYASLVMFVILGAILYLSFASRAATPQSQMLATPIDAAAAARYHDAMARFRILPVFLMLIAQIYAAAMLFGHRSWSRVGSVVGGGALVLFCWIMPMVGVHAYGDGWKWAPNTIEPLLMIAQISPLPASLLLVTSPAGIVNHDLLRWIVRGHDYSQLTFAGHLLVTGVLWWCALRAHRRRLESPGAIPDLEGGAS